MERPDSFLIWGAGGHGRVLADLIRALGHQLSGFIDRDERRVGREVESVGASVVLSEAEFLQGLGSSEALPGGVDALLLALGENEARLRALERLGGRNVPSLVHPSAVVSPSASLGRGTVVLPVSAVNARARIGRAVIVNTAAVVEHDCVLDDGAHLSPGAVLAGGVRVGERSWIGAGAVVIEGIQLGADVTVGAGAVVIRDVPGGTTVVGVPARPLEAP